MTSLGEAIVNGGGVRLLQVMENAGRNAAEWVLRMAGSGPLPRVLVLAGPEDNGAVGVCAARHLANHDVDVALALTDPTHLSDDALQQWKAFQETPGHELPIERLEGEHPDVVIDALSGYTSAGPLHGRAAQAIEWTNGVDADIVSLDVPSGINATTGEAAGSAVFPHVTVTFALPFTGLHEANAGEIILTDVGIPVGAFLRAGIPPPLLGQTPPPRVRSRVSGVVVSFSLLPGSHSGTVECADVGKPGTSPMQGHVHAMVECKLSARITGATSAIHVQ
jgi:NAD(P)H-hydrate epimerase